MALKSPTMSEVFRKNSTSVHQSLDFGHRRLDRSLIVRAARVEESFLSIPIPRNGKPGVRLLGYGIVNLRVLPSASAIGRDLDPADGATAGPRQAANLIITTDRQVMSARGPCNHGFWSQFEFEPARFSIQF